MQPALMRFGVRPVFFVMAAVVVLIVAYIFADDLRHLGGDYGLASEDCLTREEMTSFIRRHHVAEHARMSGLRSLSAWMGLVPPDLGIELDWYGEEDTGDDQILP